MTKKSIPKRKAKKAVKDFEYTIGMAELKALSKISLKRPLNNKEYNRMMELRDKYLFK